MKKFEAIINSILKEDEDRDPSIIENDKMLDEIEKCVRNLDSLKLKVEDKRVRKILTKCVITLNDAIEDIVYTLAD